jgi:hypothetical protein
VRVSHHPAAAVELSKEDALACHRRPRGPEPVGPRAGMAGRRRIVDGARDPFCLREGPRQVRVPRRARCGIRSRAARARKGALCPHDRRT